MSKYLSMFFFVTPIKYDHILDDLPVDFEYSLQSMVDEKIK
jgi:hypothetical protein